MVQGVSVGSEKMGWDGMDLGGYPDIQRPSV